MNLKIFNKTNAHYWDKQKTDWAVKDKDGYWWILRSDSWKKADKDKRMNILSKKTNQSSMPTNLERMILIVVSALLGISLASNVLIYLLK